LKKKIEVVRGAQKKIMTIDRTDDRNKKKSADIAKT